MPARLLQVLVDRGFLAPEQAGEVARVHQERGGALDTVVLELGLLGESELLEGLAEAAGAKAVNLPDFEPNAEVASFVPPKVAERMGITPLSLDGPTLHIACSYPIPRKELEEISFLLGKPLELWIAVEARVRQWIGILYKQPLAARHADLLAKLELPEPGNAEPGNSEPVTPEAVPDPDPSASPEAVNEPAPGPVGVSGDPGPAPVLESTVPRPRPTTLIEEDTLEASLTRAMFGDSSPEEPILLSRKKAPRADPEPRASEATERAIPEPARPVREPEPEPDNDWTLEEAREVLKDSSRDRTQLVDTVLTFGRKTFTFVAVFGIQKGVATGQAAKGDGVDAGELSRVAIPLDAASVFRTVTVSRATFAGPVPPDTLSNTYLGNFGRAPRTMFLHPVEVRGRLVALVYGDNQQRPVSQRKLGEFALFCRELSSAFGELLLFRKQRLGELETHVAKSPFDDVDDDPPLNLASGIGWGRYVAETKSAGRAASVAPRIQAQGDRPPPDFAPVLERLTGPDAAQRASAMAELARTPEPSAKELAAIFPGPTAWSRTPVMELPEPDELGPVPGALSKLGRAGALALAPLLVLDDSDVQYYALLTAGSLPFPELLEGVIEGLFAMEPDVSSAARLAAKALKTVPRFDLALRGLRGELRNDDALRSALAARALGALHDRDAVEPLIALTGSAEAMCAEAAADALQELTRTSLGSSQAGWTAWWSAHRDTRRADWVIEALEHADYDVRLAAIEELTAVFADARGFSPDATAPERAAAVELWKRAARDPAQARRFAQL